MRPRASPAFTPGQPLTGVLYKRRFQRTTRSMYSSESIIKSMSVQNSSTPAIVRLDNDVPRRILVTTNYCGSNLEGCGSPVDESIGSW
ncbi:hypothetical protein TNCV_206631 [Trichonephila clavipes]|nr:hypothetical protein TNCV_206631 [Trichonephila clavipes]